jgi:hypothetical protein
MDISGITRIVSEDFSGKEAGACGDGWRADASALIC